MEAELNQNILLKSETQEKFLDPQISDNLQKKQIHLKSTIVLFSFQKKKKMSLSIH